MKIKNFTTIESEYGAFIVNRHCAYQAEALIKTGRPHIQDELDKILAIVNTLPNESVVIDAGANIGLVAIPIAQQVLASKGKVLAFEAQRMMSYALCGSAALNDLENLIVHNQALGAVKDILGAGKLNYSQPQDFGLYSLVDQPQTPSEKIEMITVDSLKLSRLDFFKIDVEGMEIDVLKGASKTLEHYQPWCWVEYWKVNIDDIKAQFSSLDYKFYLMDQLNMLCAPTKRLKDSALNINAKEA